jgi:mono/diheme cytochrome c family protein
LRIAFLTLTHWHYVVRSAISFTSVSLLLVAACSAVAQVQTTLAGGGLPRLSEWLASDVAPDTIVRALTERPREELSQDFTKAEMPFLISLGRLAFRSPLIFGSYAARAGLSCDVCHTAGGTNPQFFVPDVSDLPGNVDVTHVFWRRESEDGLVNPVNIPSLRGVRWTAPYGRDGRYASLKALTRNVIVHEFAGDEPQAVVLDALVAYQRTLAFPSVATVGPTGQLTKGAESDALRGESLFERDCATCHIPSAGFIDRRAHNVGTGGHFDTPTLLGHSVTAPYFHDGRAPNVRAVIDHFESVLGLVYGPTERNDLTAYLAAIGAEAAPSRRTLAADLTDLDSFAGALDYPLNNEDLEPADLIIGMLRTEVGRIAERFLPTTHGAAEGILEDWSRGLIQITRLARANRFADARDALSTWRSRLTTDLPILILAERTSLYDPGTLRRRLDIAHR